MKLLLDLVGIWIVRKLMTHGMSWAFLLLGQCVRSTAVAAAPRRAHWRFNISETKPKYDQNDRLVSLEPYHRGAKGKEE